MHLFWKFHFSDFMNTKLTEFFTYISKKQIYNLRSICLAKGYLLIKLNRFFDINCSLYFNIRLITSDKKPVFSTFVDKVAKCPVFIKSL
jgi:hypothetical protein